MAQERVVYINGEIVPESEAKVSFRDQGFVTGDAVFDATRTFGGVIFKLKEHLGPVVRFAKIYASGSGIPQHQMADLTMQVLKANQPLLGADDDYWVIQRISRGVPIGGGKYKPTVIIECNPLPFVARARYYRDGLSVVIPSIRRTPPECMSPRVKVHNYINLLLADQEVKAQNPDAFSILLDINGNISEGFGSNFFIVKNGVVVTPKEQYVLAGISRETVIELAQGLNIEVQEADVDLYDVYTADEAFVTSTSFCLCSVSSVNGSTIGDGGVPGPVTDRIQTAYSDLVGIDIVGQYLKRLG